MTDTASVLSPLAGDMSDVSGAFNPAAPPFDPNTLAWNLSIDGDSYDPVAGIAPGVASMGSSGSNAFTAPGSKPTTGASANGHASIETDGLTQYLYADPALALTDLIGGGDFIFYAVLKVLSSSTSGPGYALAPIFSDGGGSYFALGGANQTAPELDSYFYDDTATPHDLLLGAVDGYAEGTLLLYEARLDGGILYARTNNNAEISTPSTAIFPVALASRPALLSNYTLGGLTLHALTYEVRAAPSVFDAPTRQSIRDALIAKYGI